jgi:hypothetical protein
MGSRVDEHGRPARWRQALSDATVSRTRERLYAEYTTLYDYFGRGANDVMKRLKQIKREQRGE